MTGPRQVARITHKARRLLTRAGYGEQGASRRRRKDYGPAVGVTCGKVGHTTRLAAEAHLDRLVEQGDRTGTLNVYECPTCRFFHVGHNRSMLPGGAR